MEVDEEEEEEDGEETCCRLIVAKDLVLWSNAVSDAAALSISYDSAAPSSSCSSRGGCCGYGKVFVSRFLIQGAGAECANRLGRSRGIMVEAVISHVLLLQALRFMPVQAR